MQFPHSFPADVGLGLSLGFLFDTLVVDTIFGKFRGFRNSMGTLLEVSSSFPKISLIKFSIPSSDKNLKSTQLANPPRMLEKLRFTYCD